VNEGRFRNDALLIGTEWLADRLGDPDLRIVEVTPPGSGYIFAHIPGAVYMSLDDVFTARLSGIRRTLGPLHEVLDTLGRLGISPDKHVVVYDANGGSEAAQVFWLLEYLGFERVSVLEGGAERWMAEERAQTAQVPAIAPIAVKGGTRDDRLATAWWIAARDRSSPRVTSPGRRTVRGTVRYASTAINGSVTRTTSAPSSARSGSPRIGRSLPTATPGSVRPTRT